MRVPDLPLTNVCSHLVCAAPSTDRSIARHGRSSRCPTVLGDYIINDKRRISPADGLSTTDGRMRFRSKRSSKPDHLGGAAIVQLPQADSGRRLFRPETKMYHGFMTDAQTLRHFSLIVSGILIDENIPFLPFPWCVEHIGVDLICQAYTPRLQRRSGPEVRRG
jgi:hypothetical protein